MLITINDTSLLIDREEKVPVRRCALPFCSTTLKLISTSVSANHHDPLMQTLLNSILSESWILICINNNIYLSLPTCSPSLHEAFFSSLSSNNAEGVRTVLNQVSWTEEASATIENLLNAKVFATCLDSKVYILWCSML